MNATKLLHFADWLDRTIPDEKFDFGKVVTKTIPETNCGSICCAIGWLPLYDSNVKWDENNNVVMGDVGGFAYVPSKLFDIPLSDAADLFAPDEQEYIVGWGDFYICDEYCTVKEVTDAIRHYVEIKS